MKQKFISLLLCIALCISAGIPVMAQDEQAGSYDETAIFRLQALGILQGFEDGTLQLQEPVTRAQAAVMTVKAMGFSGDIIESMDTPFTDVPKGHWASGYISIAHGAGVVEGNGDGTFAPEENITISQGIKIAVCMLGYGGMAEERGGYPSGYTAVAAGLGLLNDIQHGMEEPATRGDIAMLVDKALDTSRIVNITGSAEYEKDDETYYDILMRDQELNYVQGNVTENTWTSLTGVSSLEVGQVKIDGIPYEVGDTDIERWVGYPVKAYVKEENDGGLPTIVRYMINEKGSNTLVLDADDIIRISESEIRYEQESGGAQTEKIRFQDIPCVYNGKLLSGNELYLDQISVYDGDYRLIDNDGDGQYDVVFITERESFTIDRVSQNGNAILFSSTESFRGESGFTFNFDDDDYHYRFYDKNGTELTFADLKEDQTVTIIASLDLKNVEMIVSNNSVTGAVTGMEEDSETLWIGDTAYRVAKDADGNPKVTVEIGDYGTFLMNDKGELTGKQLAVGGSTKFGYVIDASTQSFGANAQVKLIGNASGEKIIEEEDDVETISYEYKNSEMQVLDLAGKVNLNGSSTGSTGISAALLRGNVIRYTQNAAGEINKIDIFPCSLPQTGYNFNAKILSFGGQESGFLVDDSTNIICVPLSADTDEDYLEKVTLVDKSSYSAVGIDIDEETQVAGSVVIYAQMDAEAPKLIDEDDDVSIIGKVSMVAGEEGEQIYKLTMLTRDKIVEEYVRPDSRAQEIVRTLRLGDLIRYSLGSDDRIDNIDKMASVQGLGDQYGAWDKNSPRETVYGIVDHVNLSKLSYLKNELVDEVYLSFGDAGTGELAKYEVLVDEGPVVYQYNRKEKTVEPSSTENMIGNGNLKAFMFVNNNNPEVVVIIKD